jgi:hypothetical protein
MSCKTVLLFPGQGAYLSGALRSLTREVPEDAHLGVAGGFPTERLVDDGQGRRLRVRRPRGRGQQ